VFPLCFWRNLGPAAQDALRIFASHHGGLQGVLHHLCRGQTQNLLKAQSARQLRQPCW
jgi:hypothetical protein